MAQARSFSSSWSTSLLHSMCWWSNCLLQVLLSRKKIDLLAHAAVLMMMMMKKRLLLFHKPWQNKISLSLLTVQTLTLNPNWYNSILSIQSRPKFAEHLQQCLVCDPAKIFFTSKFSYFTFLQPHS